jgi:hypothetical protein
LQLLNVPQTCASHGPSYRAHPRLYLRCLSSPGRPHFPERRVVSGGCSSIAKPARSRKTADGFRTQRGFAFLFDQSSERGSNGFAGANSPAKARSCTSHADAPALRAAIIFSGSTYSPIGRAAKDGEVFMCSVAVHSLP